MSERLSRMERYGQRRHPKDRQQRTGTARKQLEHQGSSEVGVSRRNRATYMDAGENAQPRLAEKDVLSQVPPKAEGEDRHQLVAGEFPSRREVYPSQRVKLTKYFVNTLMFIFVAVMVALFWWGISESPWGKSHGM